MISAAITVNDSVPVEHLVCCAAVYTAFPETHCEPPRIENGTRKTVANSIGPQRARNLLNGQTI
jgi:hypothetical protein